MKVYAAEVNVGKEYDTGKTRNMFIDIMRNIKRINKKFNNKNIEFIYHDGTPIIVSENKKYLTKTSIKKAEESLNYIVETLLENCAKKRNFRRKIADCERAIKKEKGKIRVYKNEISAQQTLKNKDSKKYNAEYENIMRKNIQESNKLIRINNNNIEICRNAIQKIVDEDW